MKNNKPVLSQEQLSRHANFPPQVLIDTISFCNLNCVKCARQFKPREWGTMDEKLCFKIIDEVAEEDKNTRLWFCYFGEPLLMRNKGLFERIKYAKDKGIKTTVINTNGNLMDKECVHKMIWSGLDQIFIGIDAITPEIYEQVRRGGNYQLLMDNIDYLLAQAKDKIHIVVQFGVYEENKHQVEEFRRYWESRKVKVFIRPQLTWINYLKDRLNVNQDKRYACPWIFDSLNILEDGQVPYCVCDWQNRVPQGDITKESIKEVWQKKLRKYLVLQANQSWQDLPKFCQQCPDWQTKAPKQSLVDFYKKEELI